MDAQASAARTIAEAQALRAHADSLRRRAELNRWTLLPLFRN